jgi:hypothetical protein
VPFGQYGRADACEAAATAIANATQAKSVFIDDFPEFPGDSQCDNPGTHTVTPITKSSFLVARTWPQRSFTAPLLLHGNGIAKAFTEDEKNYTNK